MRYLSRLVLACTVIAPLAASAEVANGDLDVTATVKASCSVAAAAIDFPAYDPINDAGRTSQTNLSIVCTKNHPATIGLSDGANFDLGRRMTDGTNFLNYELCQDAACTTRWGSAAGERVAYVGQGKTADTSVIVYAAIGANQNDTPAGTYADQVVIDIAF